MLRLLKKTKIFTLPNALSLFRILLIPAVVWFFLFEKNCYGTIGVLLLSGFTDVLDGWVARHFRMSSELGKVLDPLADKLTQAAVFFCLLKCYRSMLWLILVFFTCEIVKLTLGIMAIKKQEEINGAKWYGKANTVFIYLTVTLLILFPEMPRFPINALIAVCGAVMILTNALYYRFYCGILIEPQK